MILAKVAKEFRTDKRLRELGRYGNFMTSAILHQEATEKEESERMKKFHEKLKLQPMPRVTPRMRFVDLVLVETDPKTGEYIANSEKDPTKWGDWQHGGRVSDF